MRRLAKKAANFYKKVTGWYRGIYDYTRKVDTILHLKITIIAKACCLKLKTLFWFCPLEMAAKRV
jgi:hypothetical protein